MARTDDGAIRSIVVGDIYALLRRADQLAELRARLRSARDWSPGASPTRSPRSSGDPGHYVVLHECRNQATLDAHHASPNFRRYQETIGDFLARPSEACQHRVAETVQLADPGPIDPRRAD